MALTHNGLAERRKEGARRGDFPNRQRSCVATGVSGETGMSGLGTSGVPGSGGCGAGGIGSIGGIIATLPFVGRSYSAKAR